MAEADPDQSGQMDAAATLAQWTRLGVDQFSTCYRLTRPSDKGQDWIVLVAMHPTDTKMAACEQAASNKFLDELAKAVAQEERNAGRPPAEIEAMLGKVCSHGVMEGITNQQKGFMDAKILMPLMEASNACAKVMQRKAHGVEPVGTGFLVRPDMLLTVAHVAREFDAEDTGQWSTGLRSGLEFHFRPRPGEAASDWFVVLPAKDKALVNGANPHGTPTNLNVSLDPPADEQLDFSLIRLAQRVEHISPVGIVDTAMTKKGRCCWAFGFPGSNQLLMDVDLVTEVDAVAGRWLHKANAAPGMSGGCCVNHEGLVVGIHEGKISNGQGGEVNRGISIANIRRKMCVGGVDPFNAMAKSPGLEIHDATLVEDLYLAGLRLSDASRAGEWRDHFAFATGVPYPDTTRPMPPFHPWFARDEVEKWIDKPAGSDRLCLITGEDGVGKSFCGRILREKIDSAREDLLAFSPTQTNAMTWADAVSQMLTPQDPQYRTASATIRYADFDAVAEELKRRSGDGARRQNIVMDFGSAAAASGRFIGTQWPGLIATLLAFEWVRVMLIGLDALERDALNDVLDLRTELNSVTRDEYMLAPIDRGTFDRYANKLIEARGSILSVAEVRKRVRAILAEGPDAVAPERSLLMAQTALAAIQFEAGLKA